MFFIGNDLQTLYVTSGCKLAMSSYIDLTQQDNW